MDEVDVGVVAASVAKAKAQHIAISGAKHLPLSSADEKTRPAVAFQTQNRSVQASIVVDNLQHVRYS